MEQMPHNYNMPILREMYRYIIKDKSNILIGVTGRVGRGKSHTAVLLSILWNKKNRPKEMVVFTVDELMDRSLSYVKVDGKPLNTTDFESIGDVRKWLTDNEEKISITPGKVIIFDEAGTGAFVREFFSQDNKNISKVVQVWRFLRMAIFIVIPENMGIGEKNLRTFMDVEIKMNRVDRERGEATAYAYEFYDKSDPDNPKKKRIQGCRYGGLLHIKPLPSDVSEEYEKMARIHKLASLIDLKTRKNSKLSNDKLNNTEIIRVALNAVIHSPTDFFSPHGKSETMKIDWHIIKDRYPSLSRDDAQTVVSYYKQQDKTGILST